MAKNQELKQIIGRDTAPKVNVISVYGQGTNSYDRTRGDYRWWDRFRSGKVTNLELAGFLAQLAVEIISSYVLGRSVRIKLDTVEDKRMMNKVEYTNDVLRRLSTTIQSTLTTLFKDYVVLGDYFVVIEPTGNIRTVQPDIVEVIRDERNPKNPKGYSFITRMDDLTIIESFTANERMRIVKKGTNVLINEKFPVLIDRVPVVHFAHDRRSNELFGRPLFSEMLGWLDHFNDMVKNGFEGTKVSGHPIPVFENLDDPEETIEINASEERYQYYNEDHELETSAQIDFETVGALFLGTGGRFSFKGPEVGFSQDIVNMINVSFDFIKKRLHIPDHLLGGNLTVSGESANQQVKSWVNYIESKRDEFAGVRSDKTLGISAKDGLHEVIEIYLKFRKLYDPKIFVGPTVIEWTDLTEEDERIVFEKIKWSHSRAVISDETALNLLGLVDDVPAEYQKAQEEAESKQLEDNFDDFGGSGNDSDTNSQDLSSGNKPDKRKGNGADAPRMPATGGGGRN